MLAKLRRRLSAMAIACMVLPGCGLVQRYPRGPVSGQFETTNCFAPIEIVKAKCPDPPPSTTRIEDGVACAETTRNAFGEFLVCREERQLLAGGAIAVVAAGAAGVATAGISSVAAASLGATSGAGLALEVALYNKPKSKAYADASVQLQCVIGDSVPLQGKLPQLKSIDGGTDPITGASIGSATEIDNDLNELQKCEDQHSLSPSDDAAYRLTSGEYALAKRREAFASSRLNSLGIDIALTVQNIDERAFAQSQSGVPDPDQIEKGVQAISVPMPSSKGAAGGGAAGGGAAREEAEALPPPRCGVNVAATLKEISTATSALNQTLEAIRLSDPGFPQCLAIKAYDDTSSTSQSKSSTGKSSSTGKTTSKTKSNSNSGSPGSDNSSNNSSTTTDKIGSDSSPATSPTKIAFQVMPSDQVNVDKDTSTVEIKVVGGSAPYYAIAVDSGVGITQATQTDQFVSYEATLAAEAKPPQRLLVGDQGGSVEVVYISAAKKTAQPPANPPKRPKQAKPADLPKQGKPCAKKPVPAPAKPAAEAAPSPIADASAYSPTGGY